MKDGSEEVATFTAAVAEVPESAEGAADGTPAAAEYWCEADANEADTAFECGVKDAAAFAADAEAAALEALKASAADLISAAQCEAPAETCPAPEAEEGAEESEAAEGEEEAEAKTLSASECDAKVKAAECKDEDSDLSVGHSVSVLSGVLALASALF